MAKKSESSEKSESKPKAAKKAPAKSPSPAAAAESAPAKAVAKKPDAKPRRPMSPMPGGIDTGLAASAAASMLLARRKGRDQLSDRGGIEQIKSDMAKPASAIAGDVLDQHADATGSRRPNLPNTGPGTHSQTVGHAAERTFVPRRTGG